MTNYRGGILVSTLLERARTLRQSATDAEILLWQLLRNRQLMGIKFRRQHQFGHYVLDFYSHDHLLVIEIDGAHHSESEQAAYDSVRTEYLEASGLKVLRFSNTEVLQQTETVVEAILAAVWDESFPHPSPLPKGEGTSTNEPGDPKYRAEPNGLGSDPPLKSNRQRPSPRGRGLGEGVGP